MSKTIQVKGASQELRTRLQSSAERNFRSWNQEALARMPFSQGHQKWTDEALAGKFRTGSIDRLRLIAAQAKASK
jgi:hypothetical protein